MVMKLVENLLIISESNRKNIIYVSFLNCKYFGFIPLVFKKEDTQHLGRGGRFECSLIALSFTILQVVSLCFIYSNIFSKIDPNVPLLLHQGIGFIADVISHSVKLIITLAHIKTLQNTLNLSLTTISTIVELKQTTCLPYLPIIFHLYFIMFTIFTFSNSTNEGYYLGEMITIYIDMSRNCIDCLVLALCYVVYLSFCDINKEILKISIMAKRSNNITCKLKLLMDRHWTTSRLMNEISHCFGSYFFFERFASVLRMVVTCTLLYIYLQNDLLTKEIIISSCSSIFKTLFLHYSIGLLNDNIIFKSKRAIHVLQKLAMNQESNYLFEVVNHIHSFMLRVRCQDTCLSACGYFHISRQMAGKLILSTITLVVYVIQLDFPVHTDTSYVSENVNGSDYQTVMNNSSLLT